MNATIIGPVKQQAENMHIPPANRENVWAIDTPDDEVAVLQLDGTQAALTIVHITSYTCSQELKFVTQPTSVAGFSESTIVNNCEDNSTIVSQIDGLPLTNDLEYYIELLLSIHG